MTAGSQRKNKCVLFAVLQAASASTRAGGPAASLAGALARGGGEKTAAALKAAAKGAVFRGEVNTEYSSR